MSRFDKRFKLPGDSNVLVDKDECGVFIMHESFDEWFDLTNEEAIELRDALNYWYPKYPKPKSKPANKVGIKRNLSTQENRDFWDSVDRVAAEVDKWPEEKKFSCAFSAIQEEEEEIEAKEKDK